MWLFYKGGQLFHYSNSTNQYKLQIWSTWLFLETSETGATNGWNKNAKNMIKNPNIILDYEPALPHVLLAG